MRKIAIAALLLLLNAPSFAAQSGLGAAIIESDTLFFPIRTEKFMFEPFLSFYEEDGDLGERSVLEAGIGVFYLIPVTEQVSLYAGGKLSLGSIEEPGLIVGTETETDRTTISPTLGAEYFPIPNFSIALEHRIDFFSEDGEFSGSDIDTDLVDSESRILARIFF